MRCTICQNPQVSEVNVLLASGTSIRKVSQLYGLSRSTVARHRAHLQPVGSKFGVIRGEGVPNGPGDPLAEALLLAERARTPRERLRALEQVRSATKLKLRGVSEPDPEDRGLLDRNIAQAEAAYRDAGDFETAARALSGWREALHRRLDAMRVPGAIEMPLVVTYPGSESQADPAMFTMALDTYFKGVPMRFRDPDRYTVHRTIKLASASPRRSRKSGCARSQAGLSHGRSSLGQRRTRVTTKIAVHESGHALAAFVLGVAIRSVSIRPKQNHLGVTRLDATGEERLCDAAVVFACGPMSTRIAEGKASE